METDKVELAVLREKIEQQKKFFRAQVSSLETQFSLSLAAMDKATQAAFAASEKAIVKAENAQREYNERSNEFRGALEDQTKVMSTTMVSRNEWRNAHDDYGKKIDEIKAVQSTKASIERVEGLSKLIYIGVGMAIFISFLIPIVVTILRKP